MTHMQCPTCGERSIETRSGQYLIMCRVYVCDRCGRVIVLQNGLPKAWRKKVQEGHLMTGLKEAL